MDMPAGATLSPPILPFNPDNLHIVLVRPQHPGNIGATCRAMKNMGLKKLRLIDPPDLDLERARWMAPGAEDVLRAMEVFPTLEAGLEDLTTVVGTTARERHWKYPVVGPRALGAYLLPRAWQNPVAILFGQEDFGLDNQATARCELLVRIPTVDLKSLNLSQAVLIVAYELMMARYPEPDAEARKLATQPERERLVESLMALAERVEFMKSRNQEQLRALLRGMMGRVALDGQEVGILLGFVRKVRWHLDRAEGGMPEGRAKGEAPGESAEGGALERGAEGGALERGAEGGALERGAEGGALERGAEGGALERRAEGGSRPDE
jgi:TrmH family RNA methyltransferase